MTTRPAPICYGCRHLKKPTAEFKCDAFPDGIPSGILDNEVDHRKPVKNDQGIRFEPKSAADEKYAQDIFSVAQGSNAR